VTKDHHMTRSARLDIIVRVPFGRCWVACEYYVC